MPYPEWKVRYCRERVGGEEGARRLREMYKSGAPVREIMAAFNLKSPECIYALLGEEARRRRYRGRRRVTREVEEEIVKLRLQGLSMTAIAERVGVGLGTVHRVLKRHGLAGRRAKASPRGGGGEGSTGPTGGRAG
ncbi:helix-turn-helix domain-containing protein [Stetteria hydrogenophila]